MKIDRRSAQRVATPHLVAATIHSDMTGEGSATTDRGVLVLTYAPKCNRTQGVPCVDQGPLYDSYATP